MPATACTYLPAESRPSICERFTTSNPRSAETTPARRGRRARRACRPRPWSAGRGTARDALRSLVVTNRGPFGRQRIGQRGARAVVARHALAPRGGNSAPGRSCRYPSIPRKYTFSNSIFPISIRSVRMISSAMASAAAGCASRAIASPSAPERRGSERAPSTARSMQRPTARRARTMRGRTLIDEGHCVVRVWWSSATLGDGTKITGRPTRQSSDTVQGAAARNHDVGRGIGVVHAVDESPLPYVGVGCASRKPPSGALVVAPRLPDHLHGRLAPGARSTPSSSR